MLVNVTNYITLFFLLNTYKSVIYIIQTFKIPKGAWKKKKKSVFPDIRCSPDF